MLDKDLDLHDKWLGLRRLKQEYKPNPFALKDEAGLFVPKNERAEAAAQYLAYKQWQPDVPFTNLN